MSMPNLPDPVLITDQKRLGELADRLSKEPVVAVDTESNSLYAYQEQVCLIQFSTPEKDYLVDPLALEDLSPLAPIFASPEIEKVFHAAEYDVICLKRDFDYEFRNLFDTMIAARILGREAIGLGSILEKEFGVHLEKRYQRANWGQRPLPSHLLSYARLDTRYLIPLRNQLRTELKQNGRWELAREDFRRLRNASPNGREQEDVDALCWRVSGSYDLEPQQAAVLRELCRYRDRQARAQDRPLFKVIGDRTLLEIAQSQPVSYQELEKIPGMSKGQMRRHGRALLDAVRRGAQAQPIEPPRSPRPPDDFLDRVDALKRWRKFTAKTMGVKSDVVLPRDLLYELAQTNPRRPMELDEVLDDVPWRRDRFGREILKVINKT